MNQSHLLELPAPQLGFRAVVATAMLFALIFFGATIAVLVEHASELLASESTPRFVRIGAPALFLAFGLTGLFLLWRLRVHVLPYRFVIDNDQQIAYHEWRNDRCIVQDLVGCEAILIEPAWAQRVWPYSVFAVIAGKPQGLFRSSASFSEEYLALEAGCKVGAQISKHLDVPLRFEGWSASAMGTLSPKSH